MRAMKSPTALDHARVAAEVVCTIYAQRLAALAPNFVFVFDECTSIEHLFPDGEGSPLVQVMDCLSPHDFCPRIAAGVPLMDSKATTPQRAAEKPSLPPCFYLPFEPILESRSAPPTLAKALRVKELQSFGRPGGSSLTFIHLRCTHTACLRLSPSPGAEALGRAAVASYMRLATGLRAGRLLTACPSEPLLALAAARRDPRKTSGCHAVAHQSYSEYGVDRGSEGALYGRLVLIMGRDMATPRGFVAHTPLATFLAASYPSRHAGVAPRASLDNIGDEVILPHTHFLELEADVAILDAQCPSSTAFFGYEGALDAPFDETRLHLVCYQSMAGAKAAAAGDLAVASLTCPLVRYRDGTLIKPKHTLLLIDMGGTARYEASNSFLHFEERAATVPTGHGKSWNAYCAPHPNMVEPIGQFIGIRGLEPYAVLQLEEGSSKGRCRQRARWGQHLSWRRGKTTII
ncbi:hypothetical protein B0H14DRAFT_2579749 [Mycena olivaceomarginata]|nr:hypothetical protein B0H14DRAFT_2579749 [Mycena olivaceomarginata]